MHITLPTFIKSDQLPHNKEEIPTIEGAYYHPLLRHLADKISDMYMNAEILVLLESDILRVHKCNGPDNIPNAERLDLG